MASAFHMFHQAFANFCMYISQRRTSCTELTCRKIKHEWHYTPAFNLLFCFYLTFFKSHATTLKLGHATSKMGLHNYHTWFNHNKWHSTLRHGHDSGDVIALIHNKGMRDLAPPHRPIHRLIIRMRTEKKHAFNKVRIAKSSPSIVNPATIPDCIPF